MRLDKISIANIRLIGEDAKEININPAKNVFYEENKQVRDYPLDATECTCSQRSGSSKGIYL